MTIDERAKVLADYDNYSEKKKRRLYRIVQVLLSSTFIVRCKDESSLRMYQLASWEKNYLRYVFEDMMGFKLLIRPEFGVIRLSCDNDETEEENEPSNYGAGSRVNLGPNASLLLTVLFILYNKLSTQHVNNGTQYATIADIKTEVENNNIDKYFTKAGFVGEIKSALKLFKQHNLIDFKITELDIKDENTEIRLFPSLMFAINADAYSRFVEMYSTDQPSEETEDEEDEIEDVKELFDDEDAEGEENT